MPASQIPSSYDPQAIEREIYARWEEAGCFDPAGDGRAYSIVLPPPNVTGTLHMGHAFQATLMDALARYHRMRGEQVLWQPGTDHAGIATQMVVERQLAAEGASRLALGREAFVERVWRWRSQSAGTIERQFRRLGASLAWSRELFTLDPGPAAAVVETFVRLHQAGLIYRGKRLVNWDPALRTALSDLEVVSEEEDGHLWYIRYPYADGDGAVVVATTRPETMLGDVAVAVNPADDRFAGAVGQRLRLPLTERLIPVIRDASVEPEFGTGCVKITPAHDFGDYLVAERHTLPRINILGPDGTILEKAEVYAAGAEHAVLEPLPRAYAGLERFEARARIITELERRGLLAKTDRHRLKVPRGDRSGAVVEPYLTDQWFLDLTREAQADARPGGRAAITRPAIEAVRSGRIRFVPEGWARTYFAWLDNIQDWCISRQLWWGHQIPAWYDDAGNVYVGRNEQEVRNQYASRLPPAVSLRRDPDVLDTWFSSALWPLTTLGWPDKTRDLDIFYPTSVLVTGFDIIFFWVARMVMMDIYLSQDVPFRDVYVTGLIRDEHGQKMSKSKGNVLDPIDLVDGISLENLIVKRSSGMMQPRLAERVTKSTRREFPHGIPAFGADALRFTFAALASPARDINFDLGRTGGYRNFCNKLWNASRFVLMKVSERPGPAPALEPADRWIRSALARTIAGVHEQFGAYRFDLAAQLLYDFTWSEFCDWYLELVKPRLTHIPTDEAARLTLVTVLEALLRLLHPLMPFVTEALWQRVAPLAGSAGASVMVAPYPEASDFALDPDAETELEWLKAAVAALRRIRAELGLDPGRRIPVRIYGAGPQTVARVQTHAESIAFLARSQHPKPTIGEPPEAAATAVLAEATLAVPLEGMVDAAAELARLDKAIAAYEAELSAIEARLANPAFCRGAPPEVVAREKRRLAETRDALDHYRTQRRRIEVLR